MVLPVAKLMVHGRLNSNVMQVIELFKVPLFAVLLDLDTASIEKYCLDHQNKNEGRILSNSGAAAAAGSSSGGYQSHNVEISPLIKEINKYSTILSETYAIDNELVVRDMWININEYRDYNKLHSHPNSLFSGVYYVKAPDKCGYISFENPAVDIMEHTYSEIDFKEWNVFNIHTRWQEARENILYVFPGWLRHLVEPNLSNEKRISISFNIR